ncbi:SpoIIE family protein phosphatase [Roseicyclus sp. F158]|uniref:SpoIIE family protein phosphatase n=1 Tax=Tropicimonas omnivorans TaxID=3075590 RepID=A0ABU3DKY5_9RHOB|nr:ATP-binding protein [Roseicyclus sp. F158]MDT0684362.1 SpoIIE family protein phosphatase [Roseicyclus sp. F158]
MKRWIEIEDRSAIAAVRRLARRYASGLKLSENRLEEMAIVVTEATTNILRYADKGRMLIEVLQAQGVSKVVLVFTDRGPGISEIGRMVEDGISSSGSAGLGLGAIRRLSDSFDIFSTAEDGTTIVCTFEAENAPPNADLLDVEGLRVCHPAETSCGDDWFVRQIPGRADVLLCDGLGHGPKAAEASAEVLDAARAADVAPEDMMMHLTRALVGTRGAVAAMIRVDLETSTLSYSALGNITTMLVGRSGSKRIAVRDGRIGGAPTHGYAETLPLEPGDMIIMHSDGLKTLREGDLRPALLARSPLLIGAFLLDRAFRGRDDASIVVVKVRKEARA